MPPIRSHESRRPCGRKALARIMHKLSTAVPQASTLTALCFLSAPRRTAGVRLRGPSLVNCQGRGQGPTAQKHEGVDIDLPT